MGHIETENLFRCSGLDQKRKITRIMFSFYYDFFFQKSWNLHFNQIIYFNPNITSSICWKCPAEESTERAEGTCRWRRHAVSCEEAESTFRVDCSPLKYIYRCSHFTTCLCTLWLRCVCSPGGDTRITEAGRQQHAKRRRRHRNIESKTRDC